jgi:hypothetical protein
VLSPEQQNVAARVLPLYSLARPTAALEENGSSHFALRQQRRHAIEHGASL